MLRLEFRQAVWVLLALVGSAQLSDADTFWMTEAELRASFAAAEISGTYVDGRTFSEQYKKDGTLSYDEPSRKVNWSGHWSVVRGRFCTIYKQVGTGGCFRVRKVSYNCFEFYFDTRTEEEARQSTESNPRWTARAWRTDRVSTCQERPMV